MRTDTQRRHARAKLPLWSEHIIDQPQSDEEERRLDKLIRARCEALKREAGFPLDDSSDVRLT